MLRKLSRYLLALLMLCIFVPFSTTTQAAGLFKDTIGHPAEEAIKWAVENKLVFGYQDGTFKPNNEVTEAEFVAMLMRLYPNAREAVSKVGSLGRWSDPYYAVGANFNMPLAGLTEIGNRDRIITRGGVAELVTGAAGFHYDLEGSIAYLFDKGLSNGRTGKTIEGYDALGHLTRFEAVYFLKLLSDKSESKEMKTRPMNETANPSVVKYRPGAKLFYGTNGHLAQGGAYASSSYSTQLSQLLDLGMTIYRNDVWNGDKAVQLGKMADAFAGSGVQIVPVLTPSPQAYDNEAKAYDAGYSLGRSVAIALAGKVNYYEVGNELENKVIKSGQDGIVAKDYDNAKFQKARGSVRGMIDGIKSADSSSKIIGPSSGWLHLAFNEMLWKGTQPDGGSGYPQIHWDITSWHWYSDMKDITKACGGSGCYDVLGRLKDLFGQPIWLTEFGVRPSVGNDDQIADYLIGDRMLNQYVSISATYGLQSVVQYSLYDDQKYGGDGNYGLIKDDGITRKSGYEVVKKFIQDHPMP